MGTLGVGVPVRIGWVTDDQCGNDAARDARLQRGVIVEGPIQPGEWVSGHGRNGNRNPIWRVLLDSNGLSGWVAEPLLFPIDGGEDAETDAERFNETEAECSAS